MSIDWMTITPNAICCRQARWEVECHIGSYDAEREAPPPERAVSSRYPISESPRIQECKYPNGRRIPGFPKHLSTN